MFGLFGKSPPPSPRSHTTSFFGGLKDKAVVVPGLPPPRPASNKEAPKKVIRASRNYVAQYAQELSFNQGDFFYCLGEDPTGAYYEASDPIRKLRGLVPVDAFQTLGKHLGASPSGDGGSGTAQSPTLAQTQSLIPLRSGGGGPPVPAQKTLAHQSTPVPRHGEPLEAPPEGAPPKAFHGTVVGVSLTAEGSAQFTLQLTCDGTPLKSTLFRLYDDLYALQISLIEQYPREAGRQDAPRVLPFLPPPLKGPPPKAALSALKNHVDIYWQDLLALHASHPHLLASFPFKRFVLLRSQDVESPHDMDFDVSDTLLDLIDEYGAAAASGPPSPPDGAGGRSPWSPAPSTPGSVSGGGGGGPSIKIKLVNGDEVVAYRAPERLPFALLLETICAKFGGGGSGGWLVSYKDESNHLVRLRGPEDLRLILKSVGSKMIFYLSETEAPKTG